MSVFADLPSHQIKILVEVLSLFTAYILIFVNKEPLSILARKTLLILRRLNNIKVINNKFTLYFLLISLCFCINFPNVTTPYGTGNGQYDDAIDSFSEHLVRGTVQKNIYHPNDYHPFMIISTGYANPGYDWKYYDGIYTTQYRSNLALQTLPMTFIASTLKIKSDEEFGQYFRVLRKINAIGFAFLLTIFFYNFCKKNNYQDNSLIPILVTLNSGFALYSQNLYFISAVYALPMALLSSELLKKNKYSYFSVFICGLLLFLRGYEFSTLYALLVAFVCFYFKEGTLKEKLLSSINAFLIIVLSFIIVVICHICLIWRFETFPISLMQAFETFSYPVKLRSLSLHDVPFPLSLGFFGHFYRSFIYSLGFSFFQTGDIKVGSDMKFGIPVFIILTAYLKLFFLRFKKANLDERAIFIYSFLGYISWYIFGYQHIMGHGGMYNYFLFSFSIALCFSMLLITILNEKKVNSLMRTSN